MKRSICLITGWLALLLAGPVARAADAAPAPANAAETEAQSNTVKAAAATTVAPPKEVHTPDFIERLVDEALALFNIESSGNTATHFVIAGLLIVGALVLRKIVTTFIFNQLKKLASRTETTLDDKLFPALESPVATFVMLVGFFAALKVLKLSPELDRAVAYGSRVAFTLVIFWTLLRALGALLDHAQEVAIQRQLGVAAFMPWIKKTLATIFIVFGVLMVIQSFGYDVKAILAGLGIGGLAFALAAQDTIANLFGSVVVAIDQPFKIGEAVKIGSNDGVVEDIGLRSTKLRTPAGNLIIIPNKTVAAEAVTNNSRFIRRRVEHVVGLTYATTPEKMETIVGQIRAIVVGEAEVDKGSVHVYFRDFNASSLDIWIAYNVSSPDFARHMALRQRINLGIMRAVEAQGLGFAFPTQTVELSGALAEKWVERSPAPRPASP